MLWFILLWKLLLISRKFYMQANILLRNFRYCSDDVKCTLVPSYFTNMYCCQWWFNSTKSSLIKLSTSNNSVLRRLLCISKPYSASNLFVSRGILSLLNFCVNLSIDLKTELSLVQTLFWQHFYHYCYNISSLICKW